VVSLDVPVAFAHVVRKRRFHADGSLVEMTTDEPQGHSTGSRRVPRWVPYFNLIAKPLLALGVPMGPDVLITVRGRKTGLPRTTPVTICEYGSRRGFISPFGETNWARNLRAAGTATITFGRRRETVQTVELSHAEAVGFIRDVIVPIARENRFGDWFVRNVDKIDIDNPEEAAVGRPVFEIVQPAAGQELPKLSTDS
jgi:deazaflavin-dependent oxidoreductase (nitroreductase family)